MLVINDVTDEVSYYHQFEKYYGNPRDDTTWEPGEDYWFDAKGQPHRKMIPLPYKPVFILTDLPWLKDRIFEYAEKNPLMCDIHNRKQLAGEIDYTEIMSASIPQEILQIIIKE